MSEPPRKSLLEVQFPIAPLPVESFLERDARTGKVLNSLGKWWGTKPIVLTRAVVVASHFEASDDPERWPEDLEIFPKLMCFDSAAIAAASKRSTDRRPRAGRRSTLAAAPTPPRSSSGSINSHCAASVGICVSATPSRA